MDGIEMGNPKEKLTPARACGSERNASPAAAKARTRGFFTINRDGEDVPADSRNCKGLIAAAEFVFSATLHTLHDTALPGAVTSAHRLKKAAGAASMAADFLFSHTNPKMGCLSNA